MPQYASASKSYNEGDYVEDDDMEEDDEFDCLSDFDGDMDASTAAVGGNGPSTSGDRRNDAYSSRFVHRHGRKSGVSSNSRNKTDFRRYRNTNDTVLPEHSDDNRRDHHNHLERKRRASIKGSYSELREAIPNLRGSKASRAVTLRRAAEYIETLTKSNREHSFCVDELTRQNEILERQVRNLYRTYQRLENNELLMTQSAVAQSGMTVNQTGPSMSSNVSSISSTLPTPLRSGISSTKSSTPSTAAICDSNSSGGCSGRSAPARFSIPVRVVSQQSQPSITTSNTPSCVPPSTGIASSGLVQLSYAASQLQQQTPTSPTIVAAKPQVSAPTVTPNPSPLTRVITLEPLCVMPSSASPDVRQRVRLSNSLSTSSGGRPIVVVSTSSSAASFSGAPAASTNFSALDTAVLKARMARPLLEQQKPRHQHVVIGSNVEVVSSSISPATTIAVPTSVASAPNMALAAQVSGHPRRVVIVSAQHHQECPSLSAQGARTVPSKPSPH